MALDVWNKKSGYSFGEYPERHSCNIPLPVTLDTTGITFTVISGKLPPGLRIQGTYITGTPFEVLVSNEFKFCIRASNGIDLQDRTFNMTISNTNTLIIVTPEGDLPLGPNNQLFVVGDTYVDFQFEATDFVSNQELSYYITSDDGKLPEDLILSNSGRLSGYVRPAVSITDPDKGNYDMKPYDSIAYDTTILPCDGYDSYLYDSVFYGFYLPGRGPGELNRDYGFILSVTDSYKTPVRRRFNIFVVGEQYFRADNLTLPSDNERFTSDCTYLRPITWSTPSDLGIYRANNYTTVLLDTYKRDNVIYDLALVNSNYTVKSVNLFLYNHVTTVTDTYASVIRPDAIVSSELVCFNTASIYKNMPITFSATTYVIFALHTISFNNYVLLKDFKTQINLASFETGSTVRFTALDATPAFGGIEFDKIYFIREVVNGEVTYEVTDASSLSVIVFVTSTDNLFPGMAVVVTDGIGEFSPNTTVISVNANTSFILSEPPIIPLDGATVNGLVYAFSISETNDGEIVHLSDGAGTMLAHVVDTVGGIVSYYFDPAINLIVAKPYYVLDVIDTTNFIISETFNGVPLQITTSSSRILVQSIDNKLYSRSLTVMSVSNNFTGKYITFFGFIAGASSTIYSIIDTTLIATDTYRLILDIPLELNVPNNVYFYIGTLSNIPLGMSFDRNTSDIYGVIPYRPAVTETYTFTAIATYLEYSITEFFQSPKIFTMNVIGEIDSMISWVTPSDLGIIDANFISTLSLTATTTHPNSHVRYELTDGILPTGLVLTATGEIIGKANQFGNIRYRAVWKYNTAYAVNDVVNFEGTLYKRFTEYAGVELAFNINYWRVYTPVKFGITSFSDSTFSGQTFDNGYTSFDQVYVFTVLASDTDNLSEVMRTFTLNVNVPNLYTYSNIRVKPFLKISQRDYWNSFIYDSNIFVASNIYRPSDPSFGIQTELAMMIYAGIETTEAAKYVSAMGLNHKRKRFQFGSVKKAVALIPGTTTQVYEVLYVEMIDPSESDKKHLPLTVNNLGRQSSSVTVDNSTSIWVGGFSKDVPLTNTAILNQNTMSVPATNARRPEPIVTIDSTGYFVSNPKQNTYFPSSITNWRERIKDVGSSERNYLPLWMRSIQPNTLQEIDFTSALPLCYCKNGTADEILLNIKHSKFDFKLLDYTADRYIIDSVDNYDGDKYFIFKNDRITI